MEKKRKRNIFLTFIQIILLCIMLYSGYRIGSYYYQNWKSTQLLNKASDSVEQVIEEFETEKGIDGIDSEGSYDKNELAKRIIKELQKQNKDVVAFVRLKEAKINFPVVYVKEDNDYYLYKDLNEDYSLPGTIFLNGYNNNTFDDMNSTLFGHHLKVNNPERFAPMFKYILEFQKPEFVDPDKDYTIELFTEEGYKAYRVFAAYYTDIYDDYIKSNFDKEEWVEYLEDRKDRSINKFHVNKEFSEDDHIITLSTCDYVVHSDDRFVMQAVLIED